MNYQIGSNSVWKILIMILIKYLFSLCLLWVQVSLGLLRAIATHILWPPERWQKLESVLPPERLPVQSEEEWPCVSPEAAGMARSPPPTGRRVEKRNLQMGNASNNMVLFKKYFYHIIFKSFFPNTDYLKYQYKMATDFVLNCNTILFNAKKVSWKYKKIYPCLTGDKIEIICYAYVFYWLLGFDFGACCWKNMTIFDTVTE